MDKKSNSVTPNYHDDSLNISNDLIAKNRKRLEKDRQLSKFKSYCRPNEILNINYSINLKNQKMFIKEQNLENENFRIAGNPFTNEDIRNFEWLNAK